MSTLDFTDNEIKTIKDTLVRCDKEDYFKSISFHTVWFQSYSSDAELRISFLGDEKLIISRIAVSHKRQGVATEILNLLVKLCRKKGVHQIIMQSVLTPECAAFCKKNGFQPNPICSFKLGDFISGDWVLEI